MKKSYIVLFHIAYWLPNLLTVFTTIYVLAILPKWEKNVYGVNVIFNVVGLITCLLIFYLFYFFLFPRYLGNQKLNRFLIHGFVICLATAILGTVVDMQFGYLLGKQTAAFKQGYTYWLLTTFAGLLLKLIAVGVTACMLKGFIAWYNDISYKKELEKKNIQTELALLKAQINPHFLFNTLNNIDILIEKDAATASVYLKKLSNLLRFTLYESPAETVPLSKEIEGIKEYIDLQKIRTVNQNFIRFEVKGADEGLFIAPMIFIPFIENAFKHSTNKKVAHAIEIKIDIEGREINFTCVNVFDASNALSQPNSGLGLELIQNRLNMFYKDNHKLKIGKTDNTFTVNLMICADVD